jgi:Ca2+-binding EF-hand superfamily protein
MFPDYLTLMARRMSDPGLQEETIMESFAVFDKDRSGTVEAAELKHVLCKMGEFMDPKEVDKVIADFAEVDGDGKIKYADFVKNMNDQCGIFL